MNFEELTSSSSSSFEQTRFNPNQDVVRSQQDNTTETKRKTGKKKSCLKSVLMMNCKDDEQVDEFKVLDHAKNLGRMFQPLPTIVITDYDEERDKVCCNHESEAIKDSTSEELKAPSNQLIASNMDHYPWYNCCSRKEDSLPSKLSNSSRLCNENAFKTSTS